MQFPLCVWILLLALVSSVAQLVFTKQTRKRLRASGGKSIFVCLVSINPQSLLAEIEALLDSAADINRIVVGVLEYLEDAKLSVLVNISPRLRVRVRVRTVACTTWRSMHIARNEAFEHLYREEEYAFALENHVRMERDWDTHVCHIVPPDRILTAIAPPTCVSYFHTLHPAGKFLSLRRAKIVVTDNIDVVKCICDGSWWFGNAKHVRALLSCEQSRRPLENLCMPTKCLATGADPPKRRVKLSIQASHYTQLGLSYNPSAQECIAKYGSVTAANLALRLLQDR